MMRTYKSYCWILAALSIAVGINAATLFVTNLLDDGSFGSLRGTIDGATGGDDILFDVSGTIFLDETLGELVVDKELNVNGQNKIIIDGQNHINICFHITGASAAFTRISNISIQNFNGHEVNPGSGTEPQELPAYGILIDNGVEDCSVVNTTIKNIHSGINQAAAGIRSEGKTGDIINNTIMFISSEDNLGGNSGNVLGIQVENNIEGDCSGNIIDTVTSGTADAVSGSVRGIRVTTIIGGSCSGNTVKNFSSGTANVASGSVRGIRVFTIEGNCSNNTCNNLVSGIANNSGFVRGIALANNIEGDCLGNTIDNLSTGAAGNESGSVRAIRLLHIEGNCSGNIISGLATGNAGDTSGIVLGISILGSIDGNCLNNTIQHLAIGDSSNVAERAAGISLEFANNGSLIEFNAIFCITGNADFISGIEIEDGNNLTIRNNIIDFIENNKSPSHGIFLGSVVPTFVTNSLVADNKVSNILGNNGFGITITGSGSMGNSVLNNSIFSIDTAAINYEDGAPSSGVVSLSSIGCAGRFVSISGVLSPKSEFFGTDFLAQFFVSTIAFPVQTKFSIGEQLVTASSGLTQFTVVFEPSMKLFAGQFITATVTALSGSVESSNTSVVSNALFGCTTSIAGLCNVVTICPNDEVPTVHCPLRQSVL